MIHLPDFDDGILDRVALGIEYVPSHVRDLTYGRGDRVIDNDEVVVRIQRQLLGIERPFRDPSRARQRRAR